jgi:hypothetical protein
MKELFSDILKMKDVRGVMLFSYEGELLFEEFVPPAYKTAGKSFSDFIQRERWRPFIESLEGIREADLVFERGRFYIRKTGSGYLVFLIDPFAHGAMLRLNCDLLLPSLKEAATSKGFGRLFKKK